MLVLSRKPGESIDIGSGITVTVLEVSGKRARIGVQAPRDVSVLRGELNSLPDRYWPKKLLSRREQSDQDRSAPHSSEAARADATHPCDGLIPVTGS